MTLLLNNLTLSADEQERVAALHHTYGFEVLNTGVSGVTADERSVVMCYWVCKRGVRQSAVFPNHEAAWRDALRVHEEAVDAVKANPGVHRVSALPADQATELSRLKRHAEAQGYTFGKGRVGEGQVWKFNGMTEGGHDTHAKAIRGAIKHWARRDPEAFCKAMNLLGEGGEPADFNNWGPLKTPLTPLTSEELAKLQGMPGFDELPPEHQQLTLESQQLLKHMVQRGIKIDLSMLDAADLAAAAKVSYPAGQVHVHKSQGKTFEEVQEDQLRAKRAYGVVTGSLEEGKLRTLECAGYSFVFTSTFGWTCPSVKEHVTGALETVVNAAWEHALINGGSEEDMMATAKAYMEGKVPEAGWQGIGQPPPGTILWVTPHNLLWGFDVVDVYLCEVMMYDGEHVWLKLLSDLGHDIGKYTTTRIDKVDVKVWKGNKDA